MFQLDLKSGTPICDQIVNGFIRLKALGLISGGDQMPSVRALASKFQVNPNTIQKAYAILEVKGIIYSVKGKGSFVSDDDSASKAILENAEHEFRKAVGNAVQLGLSYGRLKEIIDGEENKKGEKAP